MEKTKNESAKKQKERLRNVLKPIAPTNILCDVGNGSVYDFSWSEIVYERIRKESRELAELFLFQYETGCRISEALQLTYPDIMLNGDVKLKGLKKGETSIVNVGRCAKYLIEMRNAKCAPFSTFNRFLIYRIYKKYGVVFQSENSSKKSVTHALRQAKAMMLRDAGESNEVIGKALRHKGVKNQKYYGIEKQKK